MIKIREILLKISAIQICFFLLIALFCSSCSKMQEAKEIIIVADSIDQYEHIIYSDTADLKKVITTLNNPMGRVFAHNMLGKAYYYMGRNLEDVYQRIPEAAEYYIHADCMNVDDPILRGRINTCMANICAYVLSDSLATIYFTRASEHFNESNNTWRYAQSLLLSIDSHLATQQFEEARRILDIADSFTDLGFDYQAHRLEKWSNYFYSKQEYDSALYYCQEALLLSEYMDEGSKWHLYISTCYTYIQNNMLRQAFPYARYVIEHSNNTGFLYEAYNCLLLQPQNEHNADSVAIYILEKEKINRELQDFINHYAQATVLLEQYATKTNVPSYLWAVIGIVVLFIILLGYRKFEHQIYRQSQKEVFKLQDEKRELCVKYVNSAIQSLQTQYPEPKREWKNLNVIKQDMNHKLYGWITSLENRTSLNEREIIFCVYLIIYPNVHLNKIAQHMHYTENSIRNYKTRVAKKLGITSLQLYNYLYNDLLLHSIE